MSYDGKTALNKAIAELRLCTEKSHNKLAQLTRQAIDALGLPIPKGKSNLSIDDKVKIYQWLKSNNAVPIVNNDVVPVTQSNLETNAPIDLPAINALLVPKQRNKIKREKRFNEFTRLSFAVTSNAQRQHISLEPEYIKALDLIAPNARNQWLSETVDKWIAENGVESSTRIVKCSIVNELIKRAG